jgi:hypothetical protein
MEKVTNYDRLGNDQAGNPHPGRTQTHKKRINDLKGMLKLYIYNPGVSFFYRPRLTFTPPFTIKRKY